MRPVLEMRDRQPAHVDELEPQGESLEMLPSPRNVVTDDESADIHTSHRESSLLTFHHEVNSVIVCGRGGLEDVHSIEYRDAFFANGFACEK